MKNTGRNEYVTRETIFRLLSDDEVARVSTAETAALLAPGDEYVDFENPDRGVRTAHGKTASAMGSVLPRKVVLESTWREIEVLLGARRGTAAQASQR